jgi:hypothetical protein
MCGLVVLAAATGLVSCNGDPTEGSIREGIHAVADPSSVFIAEGASKFVLVELVDALGNQLAADFEAVNVGAGVTVEEDTAFLRTTIGTRLETSRRFIITGTAPTATSFELVSGDASVSIPVKVTPASVAVSFSNPTPAANEGLVVTLPAGYKFGNGAGANVGGGPAGFVTSVAPDSSSITVLLPPGSNGPITVDSVGVDYAPGVLFSLPTSDVVTVGAVTPQAGTGSPSSAPTLTLPPPGATSFFYDGGTYDYSAPLVFTGVPGTFPTPSRLYKFTVADSTALTTAVDWPSPEDLGLYFFQSNGTTLVGSAADAGGGGVHPEEATNTFAPGTYYIAVTNFSETLPPWFSLAITTEE